LPVIDTFYFKFEESWSIQRSLRFTPIYA